MTNAKLVAGSLILALSLMGAGYAAWSETIKINNSMQSGEMRIEFVQEQDKGNINQLYNIYPNIDGNDLNNVRTDDAFTVWYEHGPTVTTFLMQDLYPGVTVWYEAKIENLGTIPAVLDNIKIDFASDASELLKSNIKVRGQMQHWRAETNDNHEKIATYSLPLSGTTQFGDKTSVLNSSPTADDGTGSRSGNGTAEGNALVTLGELEDYLNALIKANKQTLEPGDYFTFDIDEEYKEALLNEPDLVGLTFDAEAPNCLWFTLPIDAEDGTENQTAQFDIHFNFKQFNQS